MALNLEVIRGRYLTDILSQPEALRATWDGLRASPVFSEIARPCRPDRFRQIVLTGMGSSYFGLHPLSIELAAHGCTPFMVETSELIHYYPQLLTSSTLVVAVSQSGNSVEMVRMLELNAKRATVIGVTNTADSALARESQFPVLTAAGEEFSVSCKTYLAALMGQSVLGAALCGLDTGQRMDEWQTVAESVGTYLQQWEAHVREMAELLSNVRDVFLVGRGPSLATACTGGLIIKESDHLHGEGMSSAALRHGPFDMLEPGIFVGVFAGDSKARDMHDRLIEDLAGTSVKSVMFGPHARQPACRIPEGAEASRPALEMLPVQMITLALAALAGREPGKFRRATKVTTVE